MRGFVFGLVGGVSGLLGWGLLYWTEVRPLAWAVPAAALGGLSRGPVGAALAVGVMLLGLLGGRLIHYPLVAWPLLGAVLGGWSPRRLKGGAVGLVVGLLAVHLVPGIMWLLLPLLGVPAPLDLDVEGAALLLGGVCLGTMVAVFKG